MNKIMENPKDGSAQVPDVKASDAIAGNPIVPSPTPNPGAPEGQTNKPTGGEEGDKSSSYKELESRIGTQGEELGEYRQFFQNIAPLLDKLDASPELVQAIVDGKIDKGIADAIVEGRVDIKDAAVVEKANEVVKEKLGDKAYDLATPEKVAKLVETEVNKFRKDFEEKASLESFQEYSQKFIENTPDFQEYATDVDKWLDDHTNVTDIEVAYYAVKGKMSEDKAKNIAEEVAAEKNKEAVLNAAGGGQSAQYSPDGKPAVDSFIAGRPNPNTFFGG